MSLLKGNKPVLGLVSGYPVHETGVLSALLVNMLPCTVHLLMTVHLQLWLSLVLLKIYLTCADFCSCTQKCKLLIITLLLGLATYETDQRSQQVMNSLYSLLSSFG